MRKIPNQHTLRWGRGRNIGMEQKQKIRPTNHLRGTALAQYTKAVLRSLSYHSSFSGRKRRTEFNSIGSRHLPRMELKVIAHVTFSNLPQKMQEGCVCPLMLCKGAVPILDKLTRNYLECLEVFRRCSYAPFFQQRGTSCVGTQTRHSTRATYTEKETTPFIQGR